MNVAERLLARLDDVRSTGHGWRARCPAHGSSSRSLAIGEGANGTVVVHCFAGCAMEQIVAAVGLCASDLFPPSPLKQGMAADPEVVARFRREAWLAALGVLDREGVVVQGAAVLLDQGKALSAVDQARLRLAAERIGQAREVLR